MLKFYTRIQNLIMKNKIAIISLTCDPIRILFFLFYRSHWELQFKKKIVQIGHLDGEIIAIYDLNFFFYFDPKPDPNPTRKKCSGRVSQLTRPDPTHSEL